MQLLGYIVLACLVIAAAQAVLAILIIMLLIAGLICRPRETFGFLVIGGLLNLLQFYPVATICVGGTLLALVLIVNAKPSLPNGEESRPTPLLPHQSSPSETEISSSPKPGDGR